MKKELKDFYVCLDLDKRKAGRITDVFIYLEDCPRSQGIDLVYEDRTGTSSWETFQS